MCKAVDKSMVIDEIKLVEKVKTEVGGRRSEVGGQRTEGRG
jgi:molybdenum cofactor biosynthesis enzyme